MIVSRSFGRSSSYQNESPKILPLESRKIDSQYLYEEEDPRGTSSSLICCQDAPLGMKILFYQLLELLPAASPRCEVLWLKRASLLKVMDPPWVQQIKIDHWGWKSLVPLSQPTTTAKGQPSLRLPPESLIMFIRQHHAQFSPVPNSASFSCISQMSFSREFPN